MFNSDSIATEVEAEAVTFVYDLELKRLISGYSMASIQTAGTATVSVIMP